MKFVLAQVGSHQSTVLNKGSVLIGCASDADLPLDDSDVGPYECLIREAPGPTLTIWSLRTDNIRTLVNGRPITKAELRPGDRLTVGRTEFEVRYELAMHTNLKPPHWLQAIPERKLFLDTAAWEESEG